MTVIVIVHRVIICRFVTIFFKEIISPHQINIAFSTPLDDCVDCAPYGIYRIFNPSRIQFLIVYISNEAHSPDFRGFLTGE
jgi:hypothetical protein